MTLPRKIAFGMYSIVTIVSLVVGIQYLAASELTAYHKQVIGVEWGNLGAGVQTLLLVLMKGTGSAVLVCGVSLAVLLLIPFRQGQPWARWAIVGVGLTCFVPMLAGSVYLASTTGASSPWWLNVIIVSLLFFGLLLSKAQPGAQGS